MPSSYFAATDRGRQRPTNEDQALAIEVAPGSVLLAVADGVGGGPGGEVASAEAVRVLAEVVSQREGTPGSRLLAAVQAADVAVRARATMDKHLAGMATTLVAAIIEGQRATILNVGDSRAYLYREGQVRRVTEDDSWVAEQVRAGRLTGREASRSPYRDMITRAVGMLENAHDVATTEVPLVAGDVLLLCSDGLYRAIDMDGAAAVVSTGTPESAATRLIALANEAGGPDNIAVAIYRA